MKTIIVISVLSLMVACTPKPKNVWNVYLEPLPPIEMHVLDNK